ncbi:MAG: hypothetical protein FJZ97_02665 [Chloroflexi bacterium]|nr:hypothetical protein [Chloroflexota bacterium]
MATDGSGVSQVVTAESPQGLALHSAGGEPNLMKRTEGPVSLEGAGRGSPALQGVFLAGAFATLLGAFVRLAPAFASVFPVNDGGLFYVFVHEIQAAHFGLPAYSSYNQAGIPFLYPPLSFYLTGFLSSLTGISVLDLVRWLPPLISVSTVPAFYLVARRLVRADLPAAAAAFSYALLPTAFDFMIVGGGLPRALGILFCLLTLYQAADLLTHGRRSHLAATAACASLTVLSHPVVAWFMAYSLPILFIFLGRSRRALWKLLAVGVAVVLLTSPWWGVSIARHGLAPLLAAFQAGSRSWSALLAPFLFLHTNELYLTLLAVFSLLGAFLCLRRGEYLLPAWLAVVFLLETRLTATYAAIPTALLAGIGYARGILPALAGTKDGPSADALNRTADLSRKGTAATIPGHWVPPLATSFFLSYLLIAAFLAAPRNALPDPQRQAMEWVRASTPAASRFVIISGIGQAGIDYVSEWFPALTERVSVATPQGYEWFPGEVFNRRWDLHAELQSCGVQDIRCLEAWAARTQSPFAYVYLVKSLPGSAETGDTRDLYESLLSSPDYDEVYSQEDVSIFASRSVP